MASSTLAVLCQRYLLIYLILIMVIIRIVIVRETEQRLYYPSGSEHFWICAPEESSAILSRVVSPQSVHDVTASSHRFRVTYSR